jgi:hypothetical protein
LTWPDEEEEFSKHKTFLDALKGLEAESTCVFDTENNISVTCRKVENGLYRLRTQEKRNKMLLLTDQKK